MSLVAGVSNLAAPCASSDAAIELGADLDAGGSPYRQMLTGIARYVQMSGAWSSSDTGCAIAVSASSDAMVSVTPLGSGFGIVLSEGLISAVATMCELRYLHRLADAKRPSRPQIAAAQLANQFRQRRTVSPIDVGTAIPPPIHRSKGLALLFLVLHELGHIANGDVQKAPISERLAIESMQGSHAAQFSEAAADAFAADALLNVASVVNDRSEFIADLLSGVSALFETLDLLETASNPDESHPYAVWRMATVSEQIEEGTGAAVLNRIAQGSSGFWYTDI